MLCVHVCVCAGEHGCVYASCMVLTALPHRAICPHAGNPTECSLPGRVSADTTAASTHLLREAFLNRVQLTSSPLRFPLLNCR